MAALVVISDIPAHREVCGIAPTYVPADSVDNWVDALREAARLESGRTRTSKATGSSYCPSVFLDEDRGKNSGNFEFLPPLVFLLLVAAIADKADSSEGALHPSFRQDLSLRQES